MEGLVPSLLHRPKQTVYQLGVTARQRAFGAGQTPREAGGQESGDVLGRRAHQDASGPTVSLAELRAPADIKAGTRPAGTRPAPGKV